MAVCVQMNSQHLRCFLLSKLSRSALGPAGMAGAENVWQRHRMLRGGHVPARHPKVGCLSEILAFGSENADALKHSPHLISICK